MGESRSLFVNQDQQRYDQHPIEDITVNIVIFEKREVRICHRNRRE